MKLTFSLSQCEDDNPSHKIDFFHIWSYFSIIKNETVFLIVFYALLGLKLLQLKTIIAAPV